MPIEFPRKDVMSQEELKPGSTKRLAAGARIEPGALTVSMRRRPIRAVEAKERRAG